MNFWGYHLIVDIAGCNDNVNNQGKLEQFIEELLKKIDMKGYGKPIIEYFAEHSPEAEGYSLVQLIETSSITGHFSTNNRDAYIDIFSCKWFDENKALQVIFDFFNPASAHKLFLTREAKKGSEFPFEEVLPIKERYGNCNNCGICCHSDSFIIYEKGISDWLSLHGFDRPAPIEQLAMVLLKKLDQNTAKITMFEKCKNSFEKNGKILCGNYGDRPDKCRRFPQNKNSIMNIQECSYGFKE